MRLVGYTYSDSSMLCPEHAATRGFEDEDNETGEPRAIYDVDEAEYDLTCDVPHHDGIAVILERNI